MSDTFGELRRREFSRLDALGHVYLDYTGSGLYAESQVRAHADYLCGSVLGNPHSRNPTSLASTLKVEEARHRVLGFFHADPDAYEVIFTLNASGACKLVAEAYPWEPGGTFLLTADNHNSVHGVREYAAAHGAQVRYVPLDAELRVDCLEEHLRGAAPGRHHLFAFPAQSNFSGVKHPLEWIETARAHGFHVLLDAAAFVPTSRLDLREHTPDFVCLSFYKMFGFPTGVGALLMRRNALGELHRPWFSGGTVRFVSAQNQLHLPHVNGRAFEDGTLNYLGITATAAGLDFLAGIGVERINAHVMGLTAGLLERLRELRHSDGAPLVRLYGPPGMEQRGGCVAFNLLDPRGEVVRYWVVEERAKAELISLRGGFFCNPGAAECAFGYRDQDTFNCIEPLTPETFLLDRFAECMGDSPVGAVRVSLGIASNQADVDRLLAFLETFRDRPAEDIPVSRATAALAGVD
ncbi:MAG TPA: aminotransferase class V-fold PLP-dependent enzyme [Longimicrobiaceae bacterium]|nr:aminotransferase class V-fold PLP-dependent enzyme [Longimicrobiaceae bacterium]